MASFNRVLGGLEILSKYVDVEDTNQINFQHDEIFAGGSLISMEDREKLRSLGWTQDPEFGWSLFA